MGSPDTVNAFEEGLKREEAKRRKREGLVILITTLMVLLFALFEVQAPEISTDYSLTNNIAFFLLLNINIILLVLLVFLVVRNLVKLLFERKKGILGSRLRVRLVLAFVALSLVPTLLLFFIAGGFVTRSFERWFDVQVENALKGALEIGHTYYQNSAIKNRSKVGTRERATKASTKRTRKREPRIPFFLSKRSFTRFRTTRKTSRTSRIMLMLSRRKKAILLVRE